MKLQDTPKGLNQTLSDPFSGLLADESSVRRVLVLHSPDLLRSSHKPLTCTYTVAHSWLSLSAYERLADYLRTR
jgi:hypothetical protein